MKRNACPECGNKFGMLRQWLWPMSFCSKKCKEAYEQRRRAKVTFLRWLYGEPPRD